MWHQLHLYIFLHLNNKRKKKKIKSQGENKNWKNSLDPKSKWRSIKNRAIVPTIAKWYAIRLSTTFGRTLVFPPPNPRWLWPWWKSEEQWWSIDVLSRVDIKSNKVKLRAGKRENRANESTFRHLFALFHQRKPRERGQNAASSVPLLEMGARAWDYEALPELITSTAVTPSSTPPNAQQKAPKVYFHAENLPSRRRSSSRLLAPQSSYRRRSRSMSAWGDLSRSSFKLDER